MVTYSDLIYEFVQDYLKIAVECSICKESDALKDDIKILESFNKRFLILVNNIEKYKIEMEDVKVLLKEYSNDEFDSFVLYQKRKIVNDVLKNDTKINGSEDFKDNLQNCINNICQYFFDDKFEEIAKSKDALAIVKYLREKQISYEG